MGSDPLPRIHLEELQDHLVAFHNHPGSNSYEDSLRRHLREQMPQLQFVDPKDFSPILPLAPTSRCCSRPFSIAATIRRFPWTGARGID